MLAKDKEAFDTPCRTSGALIQEVLHRADAKLVISSSWRRSGIAECANILGDAGIRNRLHDDWRTEVVGGCPRAVEILSWVAEHDVEEWIAIDDMHMPLPEQNFVQCTLDDGFLMQHYIEACTKLGVLAFDPPPEVKKL